MTHTCKLQMPNQSQLLDHVRANAKSAPRMATAGSHVGQSVVICGAGPSLNDHLDSLPLADQVWACNSALPYLKGKCVRVTHGFSIDQGTEMLSEWGKTFNVEYLLASSVHPSLTRHIRKAGRSIRFFHSYLGVHADEKSLYCTLYPTSVMVGDGLNSVPRAICLAAAMGFSSITVYGADCGVQGCGEMPLNDDQAYDAWMETVPLYADGRTASVYGPDAHMCEAVIDGKRWHTRPDMVMSAVHLLEMEGTFPGKINLVGDTLPNALRGKDQAFMSRLPRLTSAGEVTNLRTERVA